MSSFPFVTSSSTCLSFPSGVGRRLLLAGGTTAEPGAEALVQRLSSGHVIVSEEGSILDADVVVDVVEVSGVLTRHRLLRVGAGESQLVEDGLVPAEEAPVVQLLASVGELHFVADVEDLAVIVRVRVIAVPETRAVEGRLVAAYNQLRVGGQLVGGTLGPPVGVLLWNSYCNG